MSKIIKVTIPGWVMRTAARFAGRGILDSAGNLTAHNYIYIHTTPQGQLRVVATDRYRMFIWKGDDQTAQFQYLVDPQQVKGIRKDDKKAFVVLHHEKGEGPELRIFSGKNVTILAALTPDKLKFGDYEWVIPQFSVNDPHWRFDPGFVAPAFARLAPFSSKGEVRVNFFAQGLASDMEGPRLEAYGENRQAAEWGMGSVYGSLTSNYQPKSGALRDLEIYRVGFNGHLMADTLDMLNDDTDVQLYTVSPVRAAVILSPNYPEVTRVIMPVMLDD